MKHLLWILLVLGLAGCYLPSVRIRKESAKPAPCNPVVGSVPENEALFGAWDFLR